MKPRKFKITNINNFTDYIGTIPVINSIATVTEESQLRIIDRQKILGDFNFEEIIEKPKEIKANNINKHDVEERSKNNQENASNTSTIKKPTKRGTRGRGRQKKQ